MRARSALRRLGLTLPFFITAALVLIYFSAPVVHSPGPATGAGASFLLVTTQGLRPAFEAFEDWNQEQGCRVTLVGLPDGDAPGRTEDMVTYLGALCALRGSTGLVLGGDRRLVPFLEREDASTPETVLGVSLASSATPRLVPVPPSPRGLLPEGLRVGRAPVRDLTEAWAFVEACQASGRTLEWLLTGDAVHSFTAVPDERPTLSPAVAPAPGPRFAVPVAAHP
jgi:hypothetical protein